MLRNLFFMIGAHKTASTHFQRSMVASQDALADLNVAVVPPVPIGTNLFPLSNLLRDKTDPRILQAAGEKFLNIHAKKHPTVMMMNENIPGTLATNMLLADDKFYRFGPRRLQRLLTLYPKHHHVIGLAIRNPATFLVSAWQESLKGHDFTPFEDYVKGVDLKALCWVDLITRMRKVAKTELPFVVWRYEDYAQVRDQILELTAGPEAPQKVTWLEETSNQGLSENALNFLQAVGHVSKKNRSDAMEMFPRGPESPPFQPFSPAQIAEFTEDYDRQWAEIQALPDCHTILP